METERIAWVLGVMFPFLVAANFLTTWLFAWLLDNRMESVEKKLLAAINKEEKPATPDPAAKRREKNRARRRRRKERRRCNPQIKS